MYDDYLLNNSVSTNSNSSASLDSLFDNLTNDINNFNKYIQDVNNQKKQNLNGEKELIEEKLRIEKAKLDFESYVKTKNEEYETRMNQIDEYLESQKQNLIRAESEFKASMDNSLSELDLMKKELEIQKEKFQEEKAQFENYKNLELNRLHHANEILESEKVQFEKYKEINNKKIELESKSLEQKCEKFKELISQLNSSFKPSIKEEE